jgi:holo-[acyl-carrier protein] synthase
LLIFAVELPIKIRPMAVLVGLDLVELTDVDDAIRAHGDSYLNRIYTPGERADCGLDTRKLAMRFAAKEATMKLLAEDSVPWRSIEVVAEPGCGVGVRLHGAAGGLARRRRIGDLSVSVSATGEQASAIVVGETTS